MLALDGALRVFGSQKQSNTKCVYGEQLHRWWRVDFCPHRLYISRFLFCIQELTDPLTHTLKVFPTSEPS